MCEKIPASSDNKLLSKKGFAIAAIAAVALGWMSASPVQAGIVFENDFSTVESSNVLINSGTNFATGFTTGTSPLVLELQSASFVLAKTGTAASVTPVVQLRSDSLGNPGSVITNLTLSGPAITSEDAAEYTFTGSVFLTPSTNYWLTIATPVGTRALWFLADTQPTQKNGSLYSVFAPPPSGLSARRSTNGGSTWSTSGSDPISAQRGTLRIEAVPEPSTLVMAGLAGLAGLATLRRRGLAGSRSQKA